MNHKLLSLLVLAACLGGATAASVARADAIPPDQVVCNGKKAGDTCTTAAQQAGTCVLQKCASSPLPDATPSTYDCLKCAQGAADAGTGSTVKGGGCSVGDVGRTAGTFAIALVPLAILALGRRRRRPR
jgi:MYXO-CTERM domain-containing protein